MLDEGTPSERKSMHLLVALGDIYGAEAMVPITWAHVAGASYKTVGDPGLQFIEEFARTGRTRVKTTVNPIGMDEGRWREFGIPEAFAEKQQRILAAYRRLGVEESWTCTPYLTHGMPVRGEHLAWAESSATLVANSLAGARTNREGGPSALAAAVTGCTPDYGLHQEEGRQPTLRVKIQANVAGAEYGLLGCALGPKVGGGVPLLEGIRPDPDEVKFLAAALGATSECAMFHIPGVTPEAGALQATGLGEVVAIDASDLEATRETLTTADDADLVVFGCPQVSAAELHQIAAGLAEGKATAPVWVFASRAVAQGAPDAVKAIEDHGGRVIVDTCPEVTPLELFAKATASPSGKAGVYLPTLCQQRFRWARTEELLRGKA